MTGVFDKRFYFQELATPYELTQTITVRFAFLAHSVRMRPTFQGLLWFECDGLGGDEQLLRSCLMDNLRICSDFISF
jgi:hypothetical protein